MQLPLRVCHIASGDSWGGAETVLFHLVCGQAARDELAPSLVLLNDGHLAKLAREAGIPVRIVPETNLSLWQLAKGLRQALAELKPVIIHSHRYKEIFLSSILARQYGAKSIVTIHGYEPTVALLDRFRFAVRDEICLRLAKLTGARFIAVSESLCRQFRLPRTLCSIIPNSIPPSIWTTGMVPYCDRKYGPGPVIGWVGRMVPVKGLPILLDAVAKVASGPLQPHLLLVGDGPERSLLENRAERLGISKIVHFTGYVTDPQPFFDSMDIFALPSLHEGVPLALLEALGAGVPVVAAAVGGIPEVIGTSGAAILVSSHSPTAWATAITELLTDPLRAKAIAECGRRLASEHYSLHSMVDRYVHVYKEALGSQK